MLIYHLDRWKSQRWKRPDGRFYRCQLKEDLFGDWVVVMEWGGYLSGRRGAKMTLCGSYDEAEAVFKAVAKRRERRGYTLVVDHLPGAVQGDTKGR